MSSGKKEKVMIACSTFDVAKVVDPVKYYGIDRIYLIHYIRKKNIYQEFYDEICDQLRKWNPNLEIIEDYNKHEVYKFTPMMDDIMQIISKERKAEDMPDIYVNISSGTHEFTAAAVIASMMWDNTIAFTAPTGEYTVNDEEKMREVYFKKNDEGVLKPVGLARTTLEPIRLSGYSIPQPDHSLVVGLGVLLHRLQCTERISATYMIEALEKKGLMEKKRGKNNEIEQKTIMKYQRNFVDKWIHIGWIVRISKREVEITNEGKQILRTFLASFDPNHQCNLSDI